MSERGLIALPSFSEQCHFPEKNEIENKKKDFLLNVAKLRSVRKAKQWEPSLPGSHLMIILDDKLDCFGYRGKIWLKPKRPSFLSGTNTAT